MLTFVIIEIHRSDVGAATRTIAIPQSDGSYRLHGYK